MKMVNRRQTIADSHQVISQDCLCFIEGLRAGRIYVLKFFLGQQEKTVKSAVYMPKKPPEDPLNPV